jgi:hypothetical protein
MDLDVWKPYQDTEYEVSNLGRVRRFRRIKAFTPDKDGYFKVGLSIRGKWHCIFVHKMVTEAFFGQRPDGYVVNHKDGIKQNNNITNLEYVTPEGNVKHAMKAGLLATGSRNGAYTHPEKVRRGDQHHYRINPSCIPRGENAPAAKLTEPDIKEIRSLHTLGVPKKTLAVLYGVKRRNISEIVNFNTWRHVAWM